MSAPSWLEVVEREAEAFACGFALAWDRAWTAGYAEGVEDRTAHRRNALVARGAVEGLEAVEARQAAAEAPGVHPVPEDQRPHVVGPVLMPRAAEAGRWSA